MNTTEFSTVIQNLCNGCPEEVFQLHDIIKNVQEVHDNYLIHQWDDVLRNIQQSIKGESK